MVENTQRSSSIAKQVHRVKDQATSEFIYGYQDSFIYDDRRKGQKMKINEMKLRHEIDDEPQNFKTTKRSMLRAELCAIKAVTE
jgi:hypothetical protein